jgi:putative heme transporter
VGASAGLAPTVWHDPAPVLPGRPRRHPAARHVVQVGVALALAVALSSQWHTLAEAIRRLGRLAPWWLAAALVVETISFVVAAELQRHLLVAGGVRLGRGFMVALTYASTAVSAVLPAGVAFSASYSYRRLTRRGSSAPLAVWTLVASGVVSTAALAVLGLAGAEVLGVGIMRSPLAELATGLIAGGATGAVVLLGWISRQPSRLKKITAFWARVARLPRALARRRRVRGESQGSWLVEAQGQPVPMGISSWLGASALATAAWVVDWAVLALAFVALGLGVPWHGLLLAYVASQLAASLPVVGCVGLAEGSLTVALVCIGTRPDSALAVALVYRLVSFWATLPIGWLAWAHLRQEERRAAPCSAVKEPLLHGDGILSLAPIPS